MHNNQSCDRSEVVHNFNILTVAICQTVKPLSTFTGVNITEEECFQLYSLGPSHQSLCKCDSPPVGSSLTPCLCKQVVSNISHDVLVGQKQVDLDPLRVSKYLICWEGGIETGLHRASKYHMVSLWNNIQAFSKNPALDHMFSLNYPIALSCESINNRTNGQIHMAI